MDRTLRICLIAGLLLLLTFSVVRTVSAVTYIDDGFIPADQTINNDVYITTRHAVVDGTINGTLVTGSGTVVINGTINGDLVSSSTEITITGVVAGSVASASRSLIINGQVDGNVFAVGALVKLEPQARINRSLYFAGFSLETAAGSKIDRGVMMNGYQASLSGEIGRDAEVSVVAFELRGTVLGDVKLNVGKPGENLYLSVIPFQTNMPDDIPSGVRVYEGAEVAGKFDYTSSVEQTTTIQSVPYEKITFHKSDHLKAALSPVDRVSVWGLGLIRETITLLVLGGLAVWLIPAAVEVAAGKVRRVLPAAGWGCFSLFGGCAGIVFLAILVVSVGILLGVVTFGGLSFAVFGTGIPALVLVFVVFILLVFFGSKVVFAYAIGKWIYGYLKPGSSVHRFVVLLMGIILYVLVRELLFGFGYIFEVIVILIGLGATWMAWREYRKPKAVEPAVPSQGQLPSVDQRG